MKRILIVEDDVVTTQVYKNLLEVEGCHVDLAPDGETAVKILGKTKPDLILLDLLLPKVHGLQVLKHVRSQPELKDVPVIVLSNAYLSTMVKAAWKEGANMCLTKADCTPDYLLAVVRTTLGSSSFLPRKGTFAAPGESPVPPSAPAPAQAQTGASGSSSSTGTSFMPRTVPVPSQGITQSAQTAPPGPPAAPRPVQIPSTPPQAYQQPTPEPTPEETTSHSFFTSVSSDTVISLQSQIRNRFLAGTPMVLEALHGPLPVFMSKAPDTEWIVPIFELYEAVHPLAGSAGVSGFSKIAHLSSALEALLKELMEDPANINSSSLRTVTDALEFLIQLIQQASEAPPIRELPSLILVVDDDILSLQMVNSALETANLRSISILEPLVGIKVVENNRFDLIFADVNMPDMDGFEFTTRVRANPQHRHTPIVMVTSLNTFEVRAKSATIGANDMIAKPFLHTELAVKALTYLYKNPSRRHGN